jgi:hypothetical protein
MSGPALPWRAFFFVKEPDKYRGVGSVGAALPLTLVAHPQAVPMRASNPRTDPLGAGILFGEPGNFLLAAGCYTRPTASDQGCV